MKMSKRMLWCGALTAAVAILLLLAGGRTASAVDTAVIDGGAANGRCISSYPGAPSGPDQLSPCQWDMAVIQADAATQAKATGKGVRVGVIDGGVDFNHPDLAGAIDVAKSCSFIYSEHADG